MTIHWGTAKRSILKRTLKQPKLGVGANRPSSHSARSLLAALLAFLLASGTISPAYAQSPAQNPPSNPSPAVSTSTIAPVSSLGLAKHDFTRGPRAFPTLLDPYRPVSIESPELTNSPRIDQLIHDGKLSLSLQDAVELALENNLDIAIQRYYPWVADASILKTKAGGSGYSTPGADFSSSTANLNLLSYDPQFNSGVSIADNSSPVNNPFISGTGIFQLASLKSHSTQFTNQYLQSFETGTNLAVSWNNTRSSSTSTANIFNPAVQSTLSVGFSQSLLNGFGRTVNTRNLRIAKNNRQIADWAFALQAIATITNTITAYWELAYAGENVKVQEQAVTVAEKLYNDNKKQLGVGTMAPLDVTRAESELATDRQNLIVAQTVKLQDEQILLNAISKDPLAANLIHAEIVTTEQPKQPELIEAASFEDSIREAFAKRPDLQEQVLNMKNGNIDVEATRRALLPTATLTAQYSSVGLAGNQAKFTTKTIAGVPVVDQFGNPVPGLFLPATQDTPNGTAEAGFTAAQSQVFRSKFPEFLAQLTLNLPLRNRSAQADNARALLVHRQLETQMQQLKNAALLDVRNTYIAFTQDRAQVEAASKARELQQQTFDAEQKKYRLGASTVYNVILTQRDLITAQGTELRALANLEEAKANYERALGRTLEVNHVTIAEAKSGDVERETLIPGTLHGKVVGTEDLFKERGQR
jgi:outer membrane protein